MLTLLFGPALHDSGAVYTPALDVASWPRPPPFFGHL